MLMGKVVVVNEIQAAGENQIRQEDDLAAAQRGATMCACAITCSVMLLMLPVSMPEICTLGHTRFAGVSCRWIPSRVVKPSGRETVRSPAAAASVSGHTKGKDVTTL